ncbi:hypothetical protein ACWDWU_30190 [Streptomyces sp. NPDC003442]
MIASSRPFRDKDEKGNNPPHLLARAAYESIIAYKVLCTREYPTAEEPRPVVFALEPGLGLELLDVTNLENKAQVLKAAGGGRGLLAALGTTRFPAAFFTAAAGVQQQRGTDAARAAVQQARGDKAEPAVQIGFGDA